MAPPSVIHVVVTRNFAGAERYVASVASETAAAGWRTAVVGGDPGRMPDELSSDVVWRPGGTPVEAFRSVLRLGRWDVCHVHMTLAEAVGVSTRWAHRGQIVATRHFAAHRGSTRGGRLIAPWIERGVDRQIAISHFVNENLEHPADAVIHNGVPETDVLWSPANRRVLVLQRLEAEKETATALHAWKIADLSRHGWILRIAGAGSQLRELRALAAHLELQNVEFAGYTTDVTGEFRGAGMLLATAPAEPLGLSVIEALAAGVPVVAAAGGGHRETAGMVDGAALYRPGDAQQAGAVLTLLAQDGLRRSQMSASSQRYQRTHLTLEVHVTHLLAAYSSLNTSRSQPWSAAAP